MFTLTSVVSLSFFIAIILAIAALSGYISERAGIVNIAIEGFLTIGALIYTILRGSLGVEGYNQIPALLITMVATSAFTLFHSFICIHLRANQVVSGTAINLVAAGVTLFLIKVVYKSAIGLPSSFAHVGVGENNTDGLWSWVNLLNILALALIVVIWLVMRFTRFGLRMIASGENPNALAAQGVSVVRIRYMALFLSGAIAGFGGALFAQWKESGYYGTTEGLGFIALAILICGQWRIPLLVVAAVVFGVLESTATNAFWAKGWIHDNTDFIQALPFALSIIVMIATSWRSKAPKAVGVPYEKDRR